MISSPERASVSAAAVSAADVLARRHTRSREASTSESTTGISANYGPFPALSGCNNTSPKNDIVS